jgi:crotonyl-CoA carboxylase/reductase
VTHSTQTSDAFESLDVSSPTVEPGTLPETMAAWVIRPEREGEPKDAFQLEEIEVPEPGPFEVIVRVMAAGVNYNNVWAALGKPVSVFGYGDHPEHGHHIGGSDASGIVWKVGSGVTGWKPGDEVVLNTAQTSYEDVEVHGHDPLAAPSLRAWGYETTWGSFAQFTKVQAQQLLTKPRNLSWVESSAYGLTYFTAYRMLVHRCEIQAGHNILIWGAAGGLGVFAVQLAKAAGANAVGVVSSDEKGELVKQLGAVDYINRTEFGEMMRTNENHPAADPVADKERFKASRGFAKRVKEILGDAPDIVFEHVGKATFPTSVFTVKPFGKIVICGANTGYNLDFDVRYLWMHQKEILGAHGANAYESMLANRLMAEGKVRPVLSKAMGFDGVPDAHQRLFENRHVGKISIMVGVTDPAAGREPGASGAIWTGG